MRNYRHIFYLLAGFTLSVGCAQLQPMTSTGKKDILNEAVHASNAYVEPDLTEFLQLFKEDIPENEEIERNFVEGCTQMMRGNLQEALELFEKVLDADPNNHPAQYNSARIYHEQKNYDLAAEFARLAVEGESGNYWYHKFLIQALSSKGDINRAISAMSQMVERFPEKYDDRIELADLYLKTGNGAQSIKVLTQLEKEGGIDRRIGLKKFHAYTSLNEWEKALETINDLMEWGEYSVAVYRHKIEMQKQLGQTQQAIQSLEALLEFDPDNGYALLNLADYYKKVDQIEKSDQYLFRAFANGEIPAKGKLDIIQQLRPYAESDPSVQTRINTLTELFNSAHPDQAQAIVMKAESNNSSSHTGSLDQYREALANNPEQTELWIELMNASYQQLDFQQLFEDAELALEYFPNQTQFLLYFGKAASRTKNYRAASYSLNKLQKIARENELLRIYAMVELAYMYKLEGNDDMAQEQNEKVQNELKSAGGKYANDPLMYEIQALYYIVQGVPELAIQEWELAIKKGAEFTIDQKKKEFGIEEK